MATFNFKRIKKFIKQFTYWINKSKEFEKFFNKSDKHKFIEKFISQTDDEWYITFDRIFSEIFRGGGGVKIFLFL
ncbi:MAG: hypothetical protein LBD46_00200 [Endomicrobium sp.]|nr:hypothetical protein [Endomicrobium sp.]